MPKNKENKKKRDGFVLLNVSSLALCGSFSLALYSSNLISMGIGDHGLTVLGNFSGWASVVFQPWIILILVIEALFGFSFYQGWGASLAIGISSAIILSAVSWILLRNNYRYLRIVSLIWIILSILNFIDFKKTKEIRTQSETCYFSR